MQSQWGNSLVARRNVLLWTLFVSGCASSTVVFDTANLPRVRRVGVLAPGFPSQPNVSARPLTDGAIFMAVSAIQAGNRSDEFAKVVASQGAQPQAEFSRALLAGLQKIGMQPVAVSADTRRDDYAKDYAAFKTGTVDAVLDVVVTQYGYYAVVNSAPFQPNVNLKARLVDLQSGVVLMQDRLLMVDIAPEDPTITRSSFPDYSDIAANPGPAVQAMMSSLDVAAGAVCKRLS